MTKESKKPKATIKKSSKPIAPPPLDIGLSKSGLVSGKKTMDIVPKGKTMPPTSAKPVIVSHRTIVKDPMAPPELTDVPTIEKPLKKMKSTKIVIEPLHHNAAVQEHEPQKTAKDIPEEKIITDTAEETELAQSEDAPEHQKQNIESSEKSDNKNQIAVNTADEEAEDIKKSTEPKLEELERERAEKRAEEAAALVESKKYFLPINAVKKRRSMRLAWLLLVILVGVVVVVGLLDAEILTFMTAPTDFI